MKLAEKDLRVMRLGVSSIFATYINVINYVNMSCYLCILVNQLAKIYWVISAISRGVVESEYCVIYCLFKGNVQYISTIF